MNQQIFRVGLLLFLGSIMISWDVLEGASCFLDDPRYHDNFVIWVSSYFQDIFERSRGEVRINGTLVPRYHEKNEIFMIS